MHHSTQLFIECHSACIDAVGDAVKHPRPVTHIGFGEAKVEKVASNRNSWTRRESYYTPSSMKDRFGALRKE